MAWQRKKAPPNGGVEFEDYFPAMVEKLGAEGFVEELCKGFELLMDGEKRLITKDSLLKNSALLLGFEEMGEDEAHCMVKEGDLDSDGCLNLEEFCILMIRLSPHLMNRATTALFLHSRP